MPPATGAPERPSPSRLVTRRRVLGMAAVAAFGASGAVTDLALGGPLHRRLRTPPAPAAATASAASPQALTVHLTSDRVAPGDLFLTDMTDAPSLVVADTQGGPIWSSSGRKAYADFRLQHWQGRPVFTWWESDSTGLAAYGDGHCVISGLDGGELARIERRNGVSPDEHEFLLTERGTALIVAYVDVPYDLSRLGGESRGRVLDGVVQEVELPSGRVLFEWRSLDHVGLAESYAGVPDKAGEPYDYFHINSVKPTPDGHLLITARHTWAVYKVDRDNGKVLWRLGGRRSAFDLPGPAGFAWPHDAQYETPTLLRLFDNGSDGTVVATSESRVLWLQLDEQRRRLSLRQRLAHPEHISAAAMGNAQRLDNGNLLVGWGTAARISEFSASGDMLFDATLPHMSYRCYRAVWR